MKNDFEKRIVLAKTDKRLAEELIIEYTPVFKGRHKEVYSIHKLL